MNRKINCAQSFAFIAVTVLALSTSSTVTALDYTADFESGKLNVGRCSGNCPTVTTKHVRSGKYAMRSYLNRLTSPTSYRTEVVLPREVDKMEFNKDYWYGFSIFLPYGWEVPNPRFEILAQFHSTLDASDVAMGPPFTINTGKGHWMIRSRAEGRPEKEWNLNSVYEDVNRWTDWVIHIKPSYGSGGVLEVWKDGALVARQTGPNTYKDAVGPYFKMGLYIGWFDRYCCNTSPDKTVYHDELRVASGPDARYADVAPK